jgi:hypothetical protein
MYDNYRKFCKSYQFCDTVELRVSLADLNEGSTSNASASATEVIFIDMKRPFNFYIEKNVLLDKKFLRWYLYSQLGRKDLANYVGLPYSKYELNMYYKEFMKDVGVTVKPNPSERVLSALAGVAGDETNEAAVMSQRIRAFTVNDNQFILIGNRYMVKVDAILDCPVFESGDKDVLQIEDVLTNYYENSVVSDTDDEDDQDQDDQDQDEGDQDQDQDQDQDADDDESAVTDYMTDTDTSDTDTDTAIETKTELPDPEFELIDPSID